METPSRNRRPAIYGKSVREDFCSFCGGSDTLNKQGFPERMISCSNCGRSGHPTCLNMLTPRLRKRVMMYSWHCIECKTCEECRVKGDDSRLMFCDTCDRGWHSYCLRPPLAKPPKGAWHCPKCTPVRSHPPLSAPLSIPPTPMLTSTPKSLTRSNKSRPRPLKVLKVDSTQKLENDATFTEMRLPFGRSRKRARDRPRHIPLAGNEAVLTDHCIRVKIPNSAQAAQADAAAEKERSTPMIVRLRAPKRPVEGEGEEDKIPYGGVISGEDADTAKTQINQLDKELFESTRKTAEAKMGGPPPISCESSRPASPISSPAPSGKGGKITPTPARSLRDRLLHNLADSIPHSPSFSPSSHHLQPNAPHGAQLEKINKIRFGTFDIDTWFTAPYPEEYAYVPEGRLWLCEFCLKYMKSGFVAERHRMKCKVRHPPGDEIYRDGAVSVFEVDGRKNKIYCQNLCLLAKMFLDHKTLYYDVEPFLFYIMTQSSPQGLGEQFVGYFSKEKRSVGRNVSCIMTLPVRQREGWGQLLIDFSYMLSKKEERVGSPEKPLSGLGAVSYKSYWRTQIFKYLQNATGKVSMKDISKATSMTLEDIYTTLVNENMINIYSSTSSFSPLNHQSLITPTPSRARPPRRRGRPPLRRKADRAPSLPKSHDDGDGHNEEEQIKLPKKYEIVVDREYIRAVLDKRAKKGYLQLVPSRLKYHPFLVARQVAKGEREDRERSGEKEETDENRNENESEQVKEEEEEVGELVEISGIQHTRPPHPTPIVNGHCNPHHISPFAPTTPDVTPPISARKSDQSLSTSPARNLRKRKVTDAQDSPARRLRSRDSITMASNRFAKDQTQIENQDLSANDKHLTHDIPYLSSFSSFSDKHHLEPHSDFHHSLERYHENSVEGELQPGAGDEDYMDAEGEEVDADGEDWIPNDEGGEEDAEGEEWDDKDCILGYGPTASVCH
ncbi:uncharacterized protein L203_101264 [Cryptococcus depauperatus CBS 7841]|uniref:Histone acetyltransferase n=1 Tax=Cryptococcus depauperatus CBS 7841 TaxID=1295531 RepID=A0AAJ8JPJ5_9TREE